MRSVPKITRDDRLVRFEVRAIGHDVLAPQTPALALHLFFIKIDLLLIDRKNSGADRRNKQWAVARFPLDNFGDAFGLIFLHIYQKHIRQIAAERRVEFAYEIRLKGLNRDDEKNPKTHDHHDHTSLIAGTVKATS